MVQVYLVALAGASCSGKTTIAKHLQTILGSRAQILHQDDFAPAAELIPMHPVHAVQDWDHPDGAIDWPRQRAALRHLRRTGQFPREHQSHDALNEQVPVPISGEMERRWRDRFTALDLLLMQRRRAASAEKEKERARDVDVEEEVDEEGTVYVLADGFLMLYDDESVRQFDVKLFVREEYETLRERREERSGYVTATGTLWRDPPDYWQNIVWPSYLYAHSSLFLDGDVEHGKIDPSVAENIVLLEANELGMEEMVEKACKAIFKAVRVREGLE